MAKSFVRRVPSKSDFEVLDLKRRIPIVAVEKIPTLDPATYRLTLMYSDGAVKQFGYADLLAYEAVNTGCHLTCHMINRSVPVKWEGIRLADFLAAQGLDPVAQFISFYSYEKYFESLPLTTAMDPAVLLALKMDDAPLPDEHGRPVRLVVPFSQGFKSVKWLRLIKFTRQDELGFRRLSGWTEDPVGRLEAQAETDG